MVTDAQIAAARRFAPPLIVMERVDRRGAKLRQVSRKAIDYVTHAGMVLEDVYPGGGVAVRELAPPEGTAEAAAFTRAAGLSMGDVYPAVSLAVFSGEGSRRRWRWRWVVVGALVGAVFAGPIGAAVGLAGGLVDGALRAR